MPMGGSMEDVKQSKKLALCWENETTMWHVDHDKGHV